MQECIRCSGLLESDVYTFSICTLATTVTFPRFGPGNADHVINVERMSVSTMLCHTLIAPAFGEFTFFSFQHGLLELYLDANR